MNKKTLTQIDYYRIRDEIAEYCVSQEGKKNILEREPFKDIEEIEKNKNLSREWEKYFSKNYSNPLFGWENIKNLLPIIKMNGSSLTLEQVNNLGHFILSVNNVKKAIENHKIELELTLLPEQIYQIPNLQDAEKKIFRVISTDGQMKELPEIVDIRKQIASLNSKIKTIMQGFTSNSKFHGVLESQVPVLRNGRQVLAVKASLQNRVPGIIHEVSQTAQTVFVEPQEAVLCSNELLQKEFELQAVIKKILTELTQSLQPSIPLFRDALPVMCLLDTTQAAQRWGNEHNCCYAQNAINEPPMLIKARHPLLGEKAVPIDIKFMSEKKVLIITGPNTGGKTVSLKTFALLSMLNQSGFPIPADEGTRLPVFSNVFADIGDDQSLDQSLSTFSGHMKNIAQAVKSATDKTLILLDELGSGTDPQEGTAIAMAVLDKLIEKKSFVLVTTHQGILKNYGYTNEYCINASVEFNQNTLSPNYHLLMGVPGESHALDIARKSGLPSEISKAAQDYILTEQADVSALIRGLNKKHIELNKIQKQNEKLLLENQEKFEKLKKKELELRRKENELKKGKQQELNDFLIHSRRQLENLVRTLKEGEITREKTLAVKQFINDLTKNTEHLEQKIEAEEEKLAKDEQDFAKQIASKNHHTSTKKTKRKMSNSEALKYASPLVTQIENSDFPKKSVAIKTNAVFEPGAYVIAGTNNSEGILIEETRKGVWQVQFGSVKMSVKQKDLKLSDNQERTLTPSVSIDINSKEVNGNIIVEKDIPRPVFELRLLGMRSEEALRSLERQIDLCLLNNFLHFSVIHGKGDGILQQVVQNYLSHSSVVASFEFAPAEDGGAGKTYVTLKG
ncbi:MAG: Smr/MutS family protein [Spirochaetia bacterium]|nr:Smr/MutS family protein [Spirochaetia bacterium]